MVGIRALGVDARPAWGRWAMKAMALIMLAILAVLSLLLGGCASNRTATGTEDRDEQRHECTVTTTETVRQVLSPTTGEPIELREKTRVVSESAATGSSRATSTTEEALEVQAPKALETLGAVLKEGAKKVADKTVPGGGAAVEWAWQAVSGVLGVGAAGAGAKAVLDGRRRRRLEEEAEEAEERRRLVAKSMNDYARDIEGATTDDQVRDIKTKHRERQRALGIHDDIERLLHG